MSNVICTTTDTVQGFKVVEYLGVVTADFEIKVTTKQAVVNSIVEGVGKRGEKHKTGIDDAREKCLELLKSKAEALDANAVVGITLSFRNSHKKEISYVVLTGTLVNVVPSGMNADELIEGLTYLISQSASVNTIKEMSDTEKNDNPELQQNEDMCNELKEVESKDDHQGDCEDQDVVIPDIDKKTETLSSEEPPLERKNMNVSSQPDKDQGLARLALASSAFVVSHQPLDEPVVEVSLEE